MCYVTGVIYNTLRVLFAAFSAVFRDSHVPAAPEPSAFLSPDLICMVITQMLWPDWLHCGMVHCSCSFQVITSS